MHTATSLPRPNRAIAVASLLAALAAAPAATAPGTWSPGPSGTGVSLLLTDGSVIQQTSFSSSSWQRFAPGADGRYDWTRPQAIAAMHEARGFFPSVVMRDGRVFVAGGEYPSETGPQARSAEIYDPLANAWTTVANPNNLYFADSNAVVLPDGKVMCLPNSATSWRYDAATGAWTSTPTNAFASNETSFVQLPGGVFFTVSMSTYPATAKYLSATNQWIPAANAPTGAEALSAGGESGALLLLYDGRVMALGVTGRTAFYAPGAATAAGAWSAGPTLPDGSKVQDACAAVMPNGHALISGDQGGHTPPTRFYDFDPATNALVNVTPGGSIASHSDPFMSLLLPTGQVLVCGVGIYTPAVGGPSDAWRPTISAIDALGGGAYRLTGTQLNGLNEGAYYGDDAQSSSNYPLVRLTSSSGAITYARTANHSRMAVASGATPVSTEFRMPALADGAYALQVVANGIASASRTVTIGSGGITTGGGTTTGGTTTGGTTTGGTTTGGTATGGTTTGGTTTGGTTTAGTTTGGTTTGGTTTAGSTTGGGSSAHHGGGGGCGAGAGLAIAVGLMMAMGARRQRG
jgi:hypothetical protein